MQAVCIRNKTLSSYSINDCISLFVLFIICSFLSNIVILLIYIQALLGLFFEKASLLFDVIVYASTFSAHAGYTNAMESSVSLLTEAAEMFIQNISK